MFCVNCRKEIAAQSIFCPFCGTVTAPPNTAYQQQGAQSQNAPANQYTPQTQSAYGAPSYQAQQKKLSTDGMRKAYGGMASLIGSTE